MCLYILVDVIFIVFFFFQAEDGIRDAQESRGLGDVYKRQIYVEPQFSRKLADRIAKAANVSVATLDPLGTGDSVSYTHLTLPTIYSV